MKYKIDLGWVILGVWTCLFIGDCIAAWNGQQLGNKVALSYGVVALFYFLIYQLGWCKHSHGEKKDDVPTKTEEPSS